MKMKEILFAAAAICIVSASQSALANGEGYNGPDLAGATIPVAVDRLVTHASAKVAVEACMTDLSKLVYQQVFKKNAPSGQFFHWFELEKNKLQGDRGYYDYSGATDGRMLLQIHETGATRFLFPSMKFGPNESFLVLNTQVPMLKFESEINDSAYDELGRLRSSRIILKNLRIDLPSEYSSFVRMKNEKSGVVTSLTVNLIRYVDCLVSKIQN